MCSKVSVTVQGIDGISPEEEKEGYIEKDLRKRKVLSVEWKSKGVMDDESGELIKDKVPVVGRGQFESQSW